MAHKKWCGKPCADCSDPCALDQSMPCSPDCELLNADGTVDATRCQVAGCDAITWEKTTAENMLRMQEIISEISFGNWEAKLDHIMLENHLVTSRRRVYICSPCRATTVKGVLLNMRIARLYAYYAHVNMGVNACAPHAYLPTMLCDERSTDRELALRFGRNMIEISDEIWVCGSTISEGIQCEIEFAKELGLPVHVFNKSLLRTVKHIETKSYAENKYVSYDDKHPFLSLNAENLSRLIGGG